MLGTAAPHTIREREITLAERAFRDSSQQLQAQVDERKTAYEREREGMEDVMGRTQRAYDDRLAGMNRELQLQEDRLALLAQEDTSRESLRVQAEMLEAQNRALIAQLQSRQIRSKGSRSPANADTGSDHHAGESGGATVRRARCHGVRAPDPRHGVRGTGWAGREVLAHRLDSFLQQLVQQMMQAQFASAGIASIQAPLSSMAGVTSTQNKAAYAPIINTNPQITAEVVAGSA